MGTLTTGVTQTLSTIVTATSGMVLAINFPDNGGFDPNFVVNGIEISSGTLPAVVPLLAAAVPAEGTTARCCRTPICRRSAAEAVARWRAVGLTAEQSAVLDRLAFTVGGPGRRHAGVGQRRGRPIDHPGSRRGRLRVVRRRHAGGRQRVPGRAAAGRDGRADGGAARGGPHARSGGCGQGAVPRGVDGRAADARSDAAAAERFVPDDAQSRPVRWMWTAAARSHRWTCCG